MSILSTLKSTFLPSAEVSAARRQATFGSTSKAKAGAIIVGTAAAAIVAPVLATSSTARATAGAVVTKVASSVSSAGGAVAKAVGKSFIDSPIKATVGTLIGAPLVIGAIAKKPSVLIDLPKKSYATGGKIVEVVQKNPVPSAIIGGISGGVLGYELIDKLFGKSEQLSGDLKAVGDNITIPSSPSLYPSGMPVSPTGATLPVGDLTPTSVTPITPATQVLGRPAGSIVKRKKKKSQSLFPSSTGQRMSVNIYNQTKTLYTGRHRYC